MGTLDVWKKIATDLGHVTEVVLLIEGFGTVIESVTNIRVDIIEMIHLVLAPDVDN